MKLLFLGLAAVLSAFSNSIVALDLNNGKWIDLTHDFSAETIYWPTGKSFEHETVFAGVTQKGFYYTAYSICAAEHGGTHMDAPIHFAEGQRPVEEIPIEQLIGPGVIVDVSSKVLKNRDYQVGVADFVVVPVAAAVADADAAVDVAVYGVLVADAAASFCRCC